MRLSAYECIVVALIAVNVCFANVADWGDATQVTCPLLPVANTLQGIAALDSTIFILGGEFDRTSWIEYDVDDRTFEQKSAALPQNVYFNYVRDPSQFYTQKGAEFYYLHDQNMIAKYDLRTNADSLQWSQVTTVPLEASATPCMSHFDDQLYVIGGWFGSNDRWAFQVYSFATGDWFQGTHISVRRRQLGCAVDTVRRVLYAIGGWMWSGGAQTLIEKTSVPATTSTAWQNNVDPLLSGGWGIFAMYSPADDAIIVTAGVDYLQVIDASTGRVSIGKCLPYAIRHAAQIVVRETLYIFGGEVDGASNSQAWTYVDLAATKASAAAELGVEGATEAILANDMCARTIDVLAFKTEVCANVAGADAVDQITYDEKLFVDDNSDPGTGDEGVAEQEAFETEPDSNGPILPGPLRSLQLWMLLVIAGGILLCCIAMTYLLWWLRRRWKEAPRMVVTVGDRVRLREDAQVEGVVQFVGPVQNKDGVFFGVDLDDANAGKNDGSFGDRRYFRASSKTSGRFVAFDRIGSVLSSADENLFQLQRVMVGDTVYVPVTRCQAVVVYVGRVQFGGGIWFGLALEARKGAHNGTVEKTWYFRCAAKHGLFVQNDGFMRLQDVAQNEDGDAGGGEGGETGRRDVVLQIEAEGRQPGAALPGNTNSAKLAIAKKARSASLDPKPKAKAKSAAKKAVKEPGVAKSKVEKQQPKSPKAGAKERSKSAAAKKRAKSVDPPKSAAVRKASDGLPTQPKVRKVSAGGPGSPKGRKVSDDLSAQPKVRKVSAGSPGSPKARKGGKASDGLPAQPKVRKVSAGGPGSPKGRKASAGGPGAPKAKAKAKAKTQTPGTTGQNAPSRVNRKRVLSMSGENDSDSSDRELYAE